MANKDIMHVMVTLIAINIVMSFVWAMSSDEGFSFYLNSTDNEDYLRDSLDESRTDSFGSLDSDSIICTDELNDTNNSCMSISGQGSENTWDSPFERVVATARYVSMMGKIILYSPAIPTIIAAKTLPNISDDQFVVRWLLGIILFLWQMAVVYHIIRFVLNKRGLAD